MTEPPIDPRPDTAPEAVPEPIADVVMSDFRPEPAQFEFTPGQERLMHDLGAKMRFVGLISIVVGGLMILALAADMTRHGLARLGALSVAPIAFILVGTWTRGAGREFSRVAATSRKDVSHLMTALEYQDRIFRFAIGMLAVVAAFVVLGAAYHLVMTSGS